jgi:hypothetical protein
MEPSENNFKPLPKESIPGFAHTFSSNGKRYDVYKLICLAEKILTINIKLSDIKSKKLEKTLWTDNNENKISPKDFIDAYNENGSWKNVEKIHPEWSNHIKRIEETDYNHPFIMYEYDIIDGIHRLVKAITDRVESIPIKVLNELPEEAIATYDKK